MLNYVFQEQADLRMAHAELELQDILALPSLEMGNQFEGLNINKQMFFIDIGKRFSNFKFQMTSINTF